MCNIVTEFYLYSIVYIYLINSRLDVTFSVHHHFCIANFIKQLTARQLRLSSCHCWLQLSCLVSPVKKNSGWSGLSAYPATFLVFLLRAVSTNSPWGHASRHQCKGTGWWRCRVLPLWWLVKTTKSLSAFLSWFIFPSLLVDG